MRKRKHMPGVMSIGRRMKEGVVYTVTVYEDMPARTASQPMRCKTKRTAKVCDPDIGQRPRTVQPARRK